MQRHQKARRWIVGLVSMVVIVALTPIVISAQGIDERESKRVLYRGSSGTYEKLESTVPSSGVNAECLPMSTEQAIASVRQAYMDAFNSGDADGVAALHTESSVQMPAGMASVTGRESIRELMQASLSAMPAGVRFEFESTDLRVADGWAVERGVTTAAPPFPAGKYVMLYEREADGCWRIAWTITNSDAPPPPR